MWFACFVIILSLVIFKVQNFTLPWTIEINGCHCKKTEVKRNKTKQKNVNKKDQGLEKKSCVERRCWIYILNLDGGSLILSYDTSVNNEDVWVANGWITTVMMGICFQTLLLNVNGDNILMHQWIFTIFKSYLLHMCVV